MRFTEMFSKIFTEHCHAIYLIKNCIYKNLIDTADCRELSESFCKFYASHF